MKLNSIKDLAKYVAHYENGKPSVSIGNIREILAVLSDLSYAQLREYGEDNDYWRNNKALGEVFYSAGLRRYRKKRSKVL